MTTPATVSARSTRQSCSQSCRTSSRHRSTNSGPPWLPALWLTSYARRPMGDCRQRWRRSTWRWRRGVPRLALARWALGPPRHGRASTRPSATALPPPRPRAGRPRNSRKSGLYRRPSAVRPLRTCPSQPTVPARASCRMLWRGPRSGKASRRRSRRSSRRPMSSGERRPGKRSGINHGSPRSTPLRATLSTPWSWMVRSSTPSTCA
mmetsp:Transcript_144368/g.462523  ORF Transcript_144368/g.462523 Transcript_144368/m.462523 type:complete len:207 (-) Transcript_144368:1102-1722(-)